MWFSESPEISLQKEGSILHLEDDHCFTCLRLYGVASSYLLLIAMLCDGYFVFVFKSTSPHSHSLFEGGKHHCDILNQGLILIWKDKQISSWFYTHHGINYKASLTRSHSVFTLSLFPFMYLRKQLWSYLLIK